MKKDENDNLLLTKSCRERFLTYEITTYHLWVYTFTQAAPVARPSIPGASRECKLSHEAQIRNQKGLNHAHIKM